MSSVVGNAEDYLVGNDEPAQIESNITGLPVEAGVRARVKPLAGVAARAIYIVG